MKLSIRVFLVGLTLAATPFASSRAETVVCSRSFISGLWTEHERGVSILGKATTSDPDTMSVYITVVSYEGKSMLYAQSNYKPDKGLYPLKVAVDDYVDVNTVLTWIAGYKPPPAFDAHGITFYVDPSFYRDPVYGKYSSQLTGKVVNLTGVHPTPGTGPEAYMFYLDEGDLDKKRKDYAGAASCYRKAVALKPDSAECYRRMGSYLYQQGQWEGSIPEFDRAIQLDSLDFAAYIDRGWAHWKLNRLDLAIADFNSVVQAVPNAEDGYYNRGFLYRRLGQYDKALLDFDRSVQINPTDPDALVQRGYVHDLLGQYAQAIADYRNAVKLNPKDSQAQKALKRAEARVGI